MGKKFTFVFSSILLLGVIVSWGVNQFLYRFLPLEFSNLWVMTLSVLGAVSAISGSVKAIQYFGELFFPPEPEPGEEDKLLQKLRELPWAISDDAAKEYTNKILGGRSSDFWKQIENNHQNADLLADLVTDPFMLEGLICIYRSEFGLLPQNTGILLDKLLKAQWTQKKIDVKQWVQLDDCLFAFGHLVIKDVPETRYPVKRSTEGLPRRWKGWYTEMLIDLGDWIDISNKNRKQSKFGKRIDKWKIRFYWPLPDFLYNVVDRLRFRPRMMMRDANLLLLVAEKAHVIKRDKDFFTFRHKSWVDYFAANHVARSDSPIASLMKDDKFNPGWRRLSPERAGIAVCASGLLGNPEQFHRDLLVKDPYLLTQCISSGLDLRGEFYEKIEKTVADELACIILQVRDGGEWRSFDFAQILQKFRYDPIDALTILDAIQEIHNDIIDIELAKLIANYGKDVVDILIYRLNTATDNEKRMILLALAWIEDQRAAPAIRELLENLKDDQFGIVRRTAMTVLAACFDDPNSFLEVCNHLFQKDERDYYWSILGRIGERALLWAAPLVLTWIDLYPDKLHIIRQEFLGLCGIVGNSEKIRKILAECLRDRNEIAFTHLYIEALGRIKAVEEKDFLLEQLNSLDDISCLCAVEALGNLDYPATIPALKQKLFHRNEQIRQSAAETIAKLNKKPRQAESLPETDRPTIN